MIIYRYCQYRTFCLKIITKRIFDPASLFIINFHFLTGSSKSRPTTCRRSGSSMWTSPSSRAMTRPSSRSPRPSSRPIPMWRSGKSSSAWLLSPSRMVSQGFGGIRNSLDRHPGSFEYQINLISKTWPLFPKAMSRNNFNNIVMPFIRVFKIL